MISRLRLPGIICLLVIRGFYHLWQETEHVSVNGIKICQVFITEPFTLKLVGSEGVRQPTDTEVKTAVWEACGDSGALQLLFDLLQTK